MPGVGGSSIERAATPNRVWNGSGTSRGRSEIPPDSASCEENIEIRIKYQVYATKLVCIYGAQIMTQIKVPEIRVNTQHPILAGLNERSLEFHALLRQICYLLSSWMVNFINELCMVHVRVKKKSLLCMYE